MPPLHLWKSHPLSFFPAGAQHLQDHACCFLAHLPVSSSASSQSTLHIEAGVSFGKRGFALATLPPPPRSPLNQAFWGLLIAQIPCDNPGGLCGFPSGLAGDGRTDRRHGVTDRASSSPLGRGPGVLVCIMGIVLVASSQLGRFLKHPVTILVA